MHNLARRCEPPGHYGIHQLRALNKGLRPPGMSCWPDSGLIHAGSRTLSGDEMVIQRIEAEVSRIAAQQNALDNLSVSSGDPPAKKVRCESGDEVEQSSDSSD
jgi:hypothetical protein